MWKNKKLVIHLEGVIKMSVEKAYNVAVVGATGAVGEKILSILQDKQFPIKSLKLLSSKRSAGKKIMFDNKEITVEEAAPDSFTGVDIAFFSAGGSITRQLSKAAVDADAVVIDNISAYRMIETFSLFVLKV